MEEWEDSYSTVLFTDNGLLEDPPCMAVFIQLDSRVFPVVKAFFFRDICGEKNDAIV